jgi:hypothetical protein
MYPPMVSIDGGKPIRAVWGVTGVAVPAGHHEVEVSVKLAVGRGGRAATTVYIPAGQTVQVEYQPPVFRTGGGSLRVSGAVPGVAVGQSRRRAGVAQRVLGLLLVLVSVAGVMAVLWFEAHRH